VDSLPEDEVAEILPLIETSALRAPFIAEAHRQVTAMAHTPPNAVEVAYDLLERLSRSLKQDSPLPLARVIGATDIRRMLRHH